MDETDTCGGLLGKVLNFLVRLDEGRFHYQLSCSRHDALMVLVPVAGQYWEIEFSTDGDVQIERFQSDATLHSLSDKEDADLLEYLLTLFDGNVAATDYEGMARQQRAFYGSLFDEVLAIIERHDAGRLADRASTEQLQDSFICQTSSILADMRFAQSFRDARRIVTNRLHHFWVGHGLRQYDEVAREIWEAWKVYRKRVLSDHERS